VFENEKLLTDLSFPCVRGVNETCIAVMVIGPAQLPMNGKTISCDDDSFICDDHGAMVEAIGMNRHIGKGKIEGGNHGVRLVGLNGHTVEGIHVINVKG